MDSDTITATLLLRDGRTLSPGRALPKVDFANWLLDELATIRAAARTA